jgi:erythromycin esterase-like protein
LTLIGTHNSHVVDARATESNQIDKINIGQLIRERFGLENTYNIGFTTYTGTVTAADSWDMDADFKRIRSSLNESIEFLFHDDLMNNGQYFFLFRSNNPSIQLSKELNDEFNEQR